jgi:predicted O-methyltransferase YrrM
MNLYLLWLGAEHPYVLWRNLTSNLHYLLVKLGLIGGAAKHVAEVREAFGEQVAQGRFRERWFDMNIVPWSVTFSEIFDRKDRVRILEVGSWEGRSSLFLLTYFTNGHLTAVDTWHGGEEYQQKGTRDLGELEDRFDENLAAHADRLTKRKGSSMKVLPTLLDEAQEYDLIYVDGSHFADDVLTDGITAWRMLREGGVIIFDDVLQLSYRRTRANPVWALKVFLKYHKGDYDVVSAGYQMILQKKRSFQDEVNTDLSVASAIQYGCESN